MTIRPRKIRKAMAAKDPMRGHFILSKSDVVAGRELGSESCFWLPVSAGDTLLGVKHIFQFQKFGCLACIVLRNLKFEFYCGFCESRKLSKLLLD